MPIAISRIQLCHCILSDLRKGLTNLGSYGAARYVYLLSWPEERNKRFHTNTSLCLSTNGADSKLNSKGGERKEGKETINSITHPRTSLKLID